MLLETLMWLWIAGYALFTLGLWRTWVRLETAREEAEAAEGCEVSVVIPVRNEAASIIALLEAIEKQSLGKEHFEVIVVDDASTDETVMNVQAFLEKTELDLRLVLLPETGHAAPKKRAIEAAIACSKGKLIVTTDGDCLVPPGWLKAFVSCRKATGAKCISGPVTFTREVYLTDYLQAIEFSSLIGSGACAISAGYPTMCNGANFAYEKQVFEEVDGFQGVNHLASGDDEFLLHKIAARYPGGIRFLKSAEAVVYTAPHRRWGDFYRQRQRWASKWRHYSNSASRFLAVYIFLSNAILVGAGIAWVAGLVQGYFLLSVLLLKLLPEWLFLGVVLRFLGKAHTLWAIPLVQVIYPLYVVFFGLKGQQPAYEWKGRKLE